MTTETEISFDPHTPLPGAVPKSAMPPIPGPEVFGTPAPRHVAPPRPAVADTLEDMVQKGPAPDYVPPESFRPVAWPEPARFLTQRFEYFGPAAPGASPLHELTLELDNVECNVRAWIDGREITPTQEMYESGLLIGGGDAVRRGNEKRWGVAG